MKDLYKNKPYLDAYTAHTDLRVEQDPHSAIGGLWQEIGLLQFGYLIHKGLRPHHSMFDLGCGTLRGGRFFIDYLEAGKYLGFDLSPKALEYADQLVDSGNLRNKEPRLILNSSKNLQFGELNGETFDFILAQSVFTHLRLDSIDECFANLSDVLNPRGSFFYTFRSTESFEKESVKDFNYSFEQLKDVAGWYGYNSELQTDYPHPRQQSMVCVRYQQSR